MIRDKIKSQRELVEIRRQLGAAGKKVVFTNGVFDILHRGHVEYLEKARQLGDVLVVGLNSDVSVKRIKQSGRPIVPQEDRAIVLAALEAVSYVCLFDEETPAQLIAALIPDMLVKGGDYRIDEIVGREVVWEHGGRVETIPLTPDRSTTDIIQKIANLVQKGLLVE